MTQTVSIRLDDDVLARLDTLAHASERSRAWLMAQAVSQFVEHEAWQIEAIEHSLASLRGGTARFAGEEEVERWLVGWGGAAESGAPECV